MGRGGRGVQEGNTCTPMADSSQCMAKPIQYCKVKYINLKKNTESPAAQFRQVRRRLSDVALPPTSTQSLYMSSGLAGAPGVSSSSSSLQALFQGTLGTWTPSLSWAGRWSHRLIFPGKSQSPGRDSLRAGGRALFCSPSCACLRPFAEAGLGRELQSH